jgi:hypothetical protein
MLWLAELQSGRVSRQQAERGGSSGLAIIAKFLGIASMPPRWGRKVWLTSSARSIVGLPPTESVDEARVITRLIPSIPMTCPMAAPCRMHGDLVRHRGRDGTRSFGPETGSSG